MTIDPTAADEQFSFFIGTTHPDEGPVKVLLDFRKRRIDHLKLDPDQAAEMIEGLIEAVREASRGRIIFARKLPINGFRQE